MVFLWRLANTKSSSRGFSLKFQSQYWEGVKRGRSTSKQAQLCHKHFDKSCTRSLDPAYFLKLFFVSQCHMKQFFTRFWRCIQKNMGNVSEKILEDLVSFSESIEITTISNTGRPDLLICQIKINIKVLLKMHQALSSWEHLNILCNIKQNINILAVWT